MRQRAAFIATALLLHGCVPDPFVVITLGEHGSAPSVGSVVTFMKGVGFEEALPPGHERPLQQPAWALRSVFLQRAAAPRLGCFVDEVTPPKPFKIYCRDMDARLNERMPPPSKLAVNQLARDLESEFGKAVTSY